MLSTTQIGHYEVWKHDYPQSRLPSKPRDSFSGWVSKRHPGCRTPKGVSLSAMARRQKFKSDHPALFDMHAPEPVVVVPAMPEIVPPDDVPGLFLGTSSFAADGWPGTFYPEGMKSSDYLRHYARTFKTVEIDSTYYGPPSPSTVAKWRDKTPPDFIFSAKVPQVITHEKMLVDCDAELTQFLDAMAILSDKLGPLVLQFPFFDRWKIPDQRHFLSVLEPFLKKLSTGYKFAVEIRNRSWLDARFADVLRKYKVSLVLQDLSSMPRPWEYRQQFDFITADFAYVRWLGDRKCIEEQTQVWDRTVLDRSADLINWIVLFRQFLSRDLKVFAYANNHYAGHGPGTIKLFWSLYKSPP
jgi:uncharacterized protein YecE (DUF72 family)